MAARRPLHPARHARATFTVAGALESASKFLRSSFYPYGEAEYRRFQRSRPDDTFVLTCFLALVELER